MPPRLDNFPSILCKILESRDRKKDLKSQGFFGAEIRCISPPINARDSRRLRLALRFAAWPAAKQVTAAHCFSFIGIRHTMLPGIAAEMREFGQSGIKCHQRELLAANCDDIETLLTMPKLCDDWQGDREMAWHCNGFC
jgi:hypothetical protein